MRHWLYAGLVVLSVSGAVSALAAEAVPATAGVVAKVAGEEITNERYHSTFAEEMRRRYYHGKIPPERLQEFEQEVLQQLADNILLRHEAMRRGIEIDKERIEEEIARWTSGKGEGLPDVMISYERERLFDKAYLAALKSQMEAQSNQISADELLVYYEANKDKFTRPEQFKLSLILLTVAPYEPSPVWQAAYDKAQDLIERIKRGEAFAALAQEYSSHESAAKGGDLGFVHAGMLSSELQEIVNALQVGGMVDKPVVILQGVAVLRLEEKMEPKLVEFTQAKSRVSALLMDERRKKMWDALLVKLRKDNPVVMMTQ